MVEGEGAAEETGQCKEVEELVPDEASSKIITLQDKSLFQSC